MNDDDRAILHSLQSLGTVRQQSHKILDYVRRGASSHFLLNDAQMESTAGFVLDLIKENHPNLQIPYHSRWRHFEVGGYDRISALRSQLSGYSVVDCGKIWFEIAIISVLLDAGAGADWTFYDALSDRRYARSEGLALASLSLYCSGALSAKVNEPLRVDAACLCELSPQTLSKAFQVSPSNPLVALDGRVQLLRQLGHALQVNTDVFGEEARLGNLYTAVVDASRDNTISAADVFHTTLQVLAPIWPKRLQFRGHNLGDVWTHRCLKTELSGSEYIPFHKLTQWLSYSLLEPLEWTGRTVIEINSLTGLPEYRNGGLFIDMGVLMTLSPIETIGPQPPQSELIVEWRALTVALLDELALMIQSRLGLDSTTLPLAKILQGGTWEAGRKIASIKREEGKPPLNILSDGTVF